MYKKVLIVALTLAFIVSMGATAVSAQTVSPITAAEATAASSATAPSVTPLQPPALVGCPAKAYAAAGYKTPTTFILAASNQSATLNQQYVWIGGTLANGASCLGTKPVQLWWKVGSGSWTMTATGNTSEGWIGWYVASPTAETIQYQLRYAGNSTYAAAKSNVVGIKFENTTTTPKLTYIWAVSPNPVAAHGMNATFKARLYDGLKGLGNRTLTVWTSTNGTTWIKAGTFRTMTGTNAGTVRLNETKTTAGTLFMKTTSNGTTTYAASTSNVVQLIWT